MSESIPQAEDDCPLSAGQQARNIFCFAGFWCLFYLSAPVSYVGLPHANLLEQLGNSNTIANLPHAIYQWLGAMPILVAWFFPQPKMLKPLLVLPMLVMACTTAAVPLAIWSGLSPSVVTWFVIAHGAVFGACNGVLLTTMWEVLRRGVSSSRRGKALGLTFGVGPLLACIGSLVQDSMFAKAPMTGISIGLPFPNNYAVLFAAATPLLLLEMLIAASFVVPIPNAVPAASAESSRGSEIMSGLRQFFTFRPLVVGAVAYLLVYSGGNAIFDNVSLHAKSVLGEEVATTLGTQQFLRFGFKAIAGVLLGWLLIQTNPKTMLLTTTAILLFGMAWVLNAEGRWYLLAFGWLVRGAVRRLFPQLHRQFLRQVAGASEYRLPESAQLIGRFRIDPVRLHRRSLWPHCQLSHSHWNPCGSDALDHGRAASTPDASRIRVTTVTTCSVAELARVQRFVNYG